MREAHWLAGWDPLHTFGIQPEDLPPWWRRIDEDPHWQKFSFIGLAIAYGIIAGACLAPLQCHCLHSAVQSQPVQAAAGPRDSR